MITRMEAYNYRCFRDLDIKISPFSILVGANGSGKSTFMDILGFLKDLNNDGLYEAIKKRANYLEEILWMNRGDKFALAVEMEIPDRIRKELAEKWTHCRYEVCIGRFKLKYKEDQYLDIFQYIKNESKKNDLKKSYKEIEILSEKLILYDDPNDKGEDEQRKENVIIKNILGDTRFISETKREDHELEFNIKKGKSALSNIPEDESRFPVSLWLKETLRDRVQIISLNSEKMKTPCLAYGTPEYTSDGSNLPLVIKNFKKEHPDQYKDWIKHLQTFLCDLKDIRIIEREEDRHLYIKAKFKFEKNYQIEIPSWLLSDGTLRMIALTLLAYLPYKDYIFLIEEPENGIHPLEIETAYQSLSSIYDSNAMVATHSPVLLSCAELDELICFRKEKGGLISVVRGTDHPRLKNWKDSPNLSILFASGVMA
ncbi:MAG: AAA family ATPase [Candidatus Eremiobacteraeota bacterium]|nr:AAA family ATPase [Candidatus Eremiobacteraeota bacterium]